jgi:hypothetical protein
MASNPPSSPDGQSARKKVWGLSKAEAEYGPSPAPEFRCIECRYMLPKLSIGTCKLVRGAIRGSYSCKEFRKSE